MAIDLFYLLPDQGLATFSAMGRIVAAFANPEEAYAFACRHPNTFVRFPNGNQLQSKFAADSKAAFLERAKSRGETALNFGDMPNHRLYSIIADTTETAENRERAQNELNHRRPR